MRRFLLICSLPVSFAIGELAIAGKVIEQEVTTALAGKSRTTRHTWSIDKRKFRLKVAHGATTTEYIFNGRTFYICGKLTGNDIEQLGRSAKIGQVALDGFRKGACQEVPSNFMARFFLSPSDAVESIDRSDGLKLTLGLEKYQLKKLTRTTSIKGLSCQQFKRTFVVTKKGEVDESGFSQSTKADEQSCTTSSITWRKTLWREVAKVVMRQPKGSVVMGQLRKDFSQYPGFTLQSQVSVEREVGGTKQQGSRTVKTTAITDKRFGRKAFKIPTGYKIFSPDSITLARATSPASKPKTVKEEKTLLDDAQSLFFCAITGAVGCFQ